MEILFDLVAGKSDEFGYKQRFVIAFEVLACWGTFTNNIRDDYMSRGGNVTHSPNTPHQQINIQNFPKLNQIVVPHKRIIRTSVDTSLDLEPLLQFSPDVTISWTFHTVATKTWFPHFLFHSTSFNQRQKRLAKDNCDFCLQTRSWGKNKLSHNTCQSR